MAGACDNRSMKGSYWPLRIAAAIAMFLCLICVFLAGMVKGMELMFRIGQVVFGAAAFVLVIIFLVVSVRKAAG
jgi:hypothetical protein